ncbi:hypothetical protein Ahy_B02g058115 isoform E [Arachis hypogaea]|uniref:Uncharacterized protein n=1 Tax=Arachis hypogaea TaxID=3818 RepID=A0A445ADV4_ARAHY|nr:hypothetical protein Ahy_B02g058115 isoform E [Arachis hypogaea]
MRLQSTKLEHTQQLFQDSNKIHVHVCCPSRETENLFKHYELTLPRGKFLSLRLECMPHFDVVNTVAMLSSLQAKANPVPHCWFFPLTFAVELLFQTPMEHVIESYARCWMPPTQELEHKSGIHTQYGYILTDVVFCCSLEHVFVPICEPPETWYMLLLDVKRPSVYALDVCISMESVPRRERNMRLIMAVIGNIFKLEPNLPNFKHVSPYPNSWGRMEYPMSIPSRLGADESGIWCIWWMSHNGRFSPAILGNLGDEATLRMKTAIRIVASDYSELKALVDLKAETVWRSLPFLP